VKGGGEKQISNDWISHGPRGGHEEISEIADAGLIETRNRRVTTVHRQKGRGGWISGVARRIRSGVTIEIGSTKKIRYSAKRGALTAAAENLINLMLPYTDSERKIGVEGYRSVSSHTY